MIVTLWAVALVVVAIYNTATSHVTVQYYVFP